RRFIADMGDGNFAAAARLAFRDWADVYDGWNRPGALMTFQGGMAVGKCLSEVAVQVSGAYFTGGTLNLVTQAVNVVRGMVRGNIRLISCSTGGGSAAQNLANQLGVTVRAPTNVVWVHSNGTITAPIGTVWRDFIPGVRP